jgi:protocatechuate 3,4-dioxygenase beta subunit
MGLFASRREFLGCCAGGLVLARSAAAADDPFEALPAAVLHNSTKNGLIMIRHPAPADTGWRTRIVSSGEPGERLVVSGVVVAPDGTTPAAGVTIYAYNTDAEGYYGANHTFAPPRLYGWMKTDAGGRFELQTIKPGCYPDHRTAAHIHFSAWGAGYPPQWFDELRFVGDPYLAPGQAARPLTRGDDGLLHCSFRIKLARQSNFGAA